MFAVHDPLIFVKMKARRADEHFQALERERAKWATNPYTITEKTDFEKSLHVFSIQVTPTPESIPMLFGDFVCNLRASLDQLAWRLAHLSPLRTFTRSEQRRINFPIFEDSNTYADRRKLFPSAVADIMDTLQPYLRGNAFRDDPLWQLNELWNLDKHRTIPTSPYTIHLGIAEGLERYALKRMNRFTYDLEVAFPLVLAWAGNMNLKPEVSIEILFGETDVFEVSLDRLREINNFIRDKVIPRFTGFFT